MDPLRGSFTLCSSRFCIAPYALHFEMLRGPALKYWNSLLQLCCMRTDSRSAKGSMHLYGSSFGLKGGGYTMASGSLPRYVYMTYIYIYICVFYMPIHIHIIYIYTHIFMHLFTYTHAYYKAAAVGSLSMRGSRRGPRLRTRHQVIQDRGPLMGSPGSPKGSL